MPTTDLTNSNISDTYQGMLHFRGEQLPASGQIDVFDGIGNKTSIKIGRACNGVTVCGPLQCQEIKVSDWSITKQGIIDLIYPIGSTIYSSYPTNPGLRYPGTTWEQVAQGRFIVSVGTGPAQAGMPAGANVYGPGNDSRGEYYHTLTLPEIPPHHHTINIYQNRNPIHRKFDQQDIVLPGANGINTGTAGGGQSHINTPPAYGLYVYSRTQ